MTAPREADARATVNILLVDDQPEGLIVLESLLAELGHNLVCARSGRDALRHLLAEDFAVILLDVQMPDMDGYETAALIRTRPRSRTTPIIFLTATHPSDVQTERGYSVGAVDYLFKPLDPAIMRSKVAVFVDLFVATELARRQADELEEKNRELASLNKELETFSYSVSHDLRAPLRSIDGFSAALAEDCGPSLDEQGLDYVQRIRQSVRRMTQLIDGMLELSRVTRSELRRDRVDLAAIARGVFARLRSQDPERQVELLCADAMWAEGDPRLLEIVIDNLLRNAWKFTGKCSGPCIEVGRHGDAFFVRDNGAGFDMTYAGKLFAAFQRLHAATDYEGTGIGLATVQRIIHRHRGRIWAEGEPDKGATFFFTLDD
jgi:two-component system sensor histidine kinase/response regulator